MATSNRTAPKNTGKLMHSWAKLGARSRGSEVAVASKVHAEAGTEYVASGSLENNAGVGKAPVSASSAQTNNTEQPQAHDARSLTSGESADTVGNQTPSNRSTSFSIALWETS